MFFRNLVLFKPVLRLRFVNQFVKPSSAITKPQELSRQPFGNLEPRSCSIEGELPSVFLVLVPPSQLSHGNLPWLADDAQTSAEPCPEARARVS